MSGGGQRSVSGPDPDSGRQFGMRRRQYLGAVAGLAVATAGCLHGDDDDGIEAKDWNAVRGDVARSGRTSKDQGPGESLSVAWNSNARQLVEEIESVEFKPELGPEVDLSHPVIHDEYAIFQLRYRAIPQFIESPDDVGEEPLEGTYVVGISLAEGSLAWQYEVATEKKMFWSTSLQVVDGSVFVGCPTIDESWIDVVDATSGDREKRIDLDRFVTQFVVADGTLYASQGWRQYQAIDIGDDSVRWTYDDMGHQVPHRLVSLSSELLLLAGNWGLDAYSTEAGAHEWVRNDVSVKAVTTDGDVGFVNTGLTHNSSLTVVNLDDGSTRWEFEPEPYTPDSDGDSSEEVPENQRWVLGHPVVLDDLVLTVASGEPTDEALIPWYLYGLDRSDGTERWSHYLGTPASSPVVAGDVVYTGNRAISTDGEELDAMDPETHFAGNPAVRDGRIVAIAGQPDSVDIIAVE